ncbi:type II toxin-antitoxin system HicA family toxin [Serratia plymuthica]|uniref:type II toxin-antitoxin system HicA family toxin n=1 Tax=Serratia plymuthica TaxID=82996 RepID=UPI0009369535|nr:type II toxin-antitoxin system HicA family toxin [Serratia plymuthica]OJT43425.1 toxin HicA [Serratia plymuthica]
MKNAEPIRLLEREGWVLERIKGSHPQFKHPRSRLVITVPHPRKDPKPPVMNY